MVGGIGWRVEGWRAEGQGMGVGHGEVVGRRREEADWKEKENVYKKGLQLDYNNIQFIQLYTYIGQNIVRSIYIENIYK